MYEDHGSLSRVSRIVDEEKYVDSNSVNLYLAITLTQLEDMTVRLKTMRFVDIDDAT